MPRFPSAQGRLNHEPGFHLSCDEHLSEGWGPPLCAFGPCAWPTRCGAWRSCSRINRRTRSSEVRIPATRSFAQAFRYPSP